MWIIFHTVGYILQHGIPKSVKVQNIDCLVCYNNNPNDPMLLDNSDSPSIVEQLSQGPSLVNNTFIDNSS